MSRIFYILIFIYLLSCSHVMAQGKGGVSVHSDPRLALLINKTKAPDRVEEFRPAAPKREALKRDRNIPALASRSAESRNIEPKSASGKGSKSSEEPKMVRRDFRASSVGYSYNGNGFRVQIYNGPDRTAALRIKAEFMRNYPGVRTYLTYASPHYRVKVGDFRRRDDAMGMFREASGTYSPCMIVPDMLGSKTN